MRTLSFVAALALLSRLFGAGSISAQDLSVVSDPESYALYSVILQPMWTNRSNEPLLLQRETVSSESMQRLSSCDTLVPEWGDIQDDFRRTNSVVHLLEPRLTVTIPYRFIARADIQAADERLALKYPGIWQRRPESVEYAAVSAVGFDQTRTKALVYVRLRSSGEIQGWEQRDGQWIRMGVGCFWVA